MFHTPRAGRTEALGPFAPQRYCEAQKENRCEVVAELGVVALVVRAKLACAVEVEQLVVVALVVRAKVAEVVELLLAVPKVGKRSVGMCGRPSPDHGG